MATNKHATIRYHALDKCFSNIGRKYFIKDLINACNDAIYDFTGKLQTVKRRQIFEDIKFMESEQGWAIPLDRIRVGRRIYYRYSEKNFSIKKQIINEMEANQLKETLLILNKFKGMPYFSWMEELLIRIESTFKFKTNSNPIVGFDQNPYLIGLNYFTELFNAIYYKKVLSVSYRGFKQKKSTKICLHPYFLKQYNNRWFLFGLNEQTNSISNLAIDRIIDIEEKNYDYIENKTINFGEYFEDVVGVTVKENQLPVKILLQISNELFPYIERKPIHGSQKIKGKNIKGVLVELLVQINYELIAQIFSFGEEIKVLEPKELKDILKIKAEKIYKNYS